MAKDNQTNTNTNIINNHHNNNMSNITKDRGGNDDNTTKERNVKHRDTMMLKVKSAGQLSRGIYSVGLLPLFLAV